MSKDILKQLREAGQQEVSEGINLNAPIHYEVDEVDGSVNANIEGLREPVKVDILCEYSSNSVYDSDKGWIDVKGVQIKSFKIIDVRDEYGVVPEGQLEAIKAKIMKDPSVQMVV